MPAYTRETFDRLRAGSAAVERREGRILALFAVPGGLAQLFLLRWLEHRYPHERAVTIEGVVFLGYIAGVILLLWRMQQKVRVARVRCPACGVVLRALSERVAVATGRCDACGGQVILDASTST